MKKLIMMLLVFSSVLTALADVNYMITGKTSEDMNGRILYLSISGRQSRMPQDSAVVANCSFVFKGETESTDIGTIYAKPAKGTVPVFCRVGIEETPVFVDFTDKEHPVLSGGRLSGRLNEYADSMMVMNELQEKLQLKELNIEFRDSLTTAERRKEIRTVYDIYYAKDEQIRKALLNKNLDNVLGAFLFISMYYSDEDGEALIRKAGKEFQEYPLVRRKLEQINAAKVRRPGNKYIDFEQPDVEGKLHKLSDYIGTGKYILIDFWASWCGPCRAEIPNVKAAYEKYHAKGFEIIGVSLDNKKEAWTKAIDQLGMPWVNLSDLQGWKNAASQKYGVNGIPCTLLLDPNGVIIGGGYRGEELAKKLEELLK